MRTSLILLLVSLTITSTTASDTRHLSNQHQEVDVAKHGLRQGSDTFDTAFNKIKTETGLSFLGGKKLNTYSIDRSDSDKHMSALEMSSKVSVGKMNHCENCVYVLERIKQGYQYLLPSICVEIYSKENDQATYGVCHEVLASLSVWGNNVRHWLHYGCYKAESYGAMELIRPCPSHIICSQMADFKKLAFCGKQKQEKLEDGTK